MDETEVAFYARKCPNLKYKFNGVFAADNFPILARNNTFQVINADPASHAGSHWMVLCRRDEQLVFADPLGRPINYYTTLYLRMCSFYASVLDFTCSFAIQAPQSNRCGK